MNEPEQSYIGLKPCGCVAMTVRERAPNAPEMVAEVIRKGGTVERVPVEVARFTRRHCQAHAEPARQEGMFGPEDAPVKPTPREYPS